MVEQRKTEVEATNTLWSIAEDYLRREERKKQLRSIESGGGYSSATSTPRWARANRHHQALRDRPLLDRIEDENGAGWPTMCWRPAPDHELARQRSDDFRAPLSAA